MKLIPVLTLNYANTARWIMDLYGERIDQFRYNLNDVSLKDGTILKMVQTREHLLGLEFTEFIISPHYWDLRMEAENRRNICKSRLDGDPK